MTEKIVLDPDSGIAPYEQLRTQLSELARSGVLPVGHRLPTVRGFAEELGLAANTVAKAYRALEADGVIETRGGTGPSSRPPGERPSRRPPPPRRATRRPPSGSGCPGTGRCRSPRTRSGPRTRADPTGPTGYGPHPSA
ncbi:hypothetical protein Smic_13810 [Streptomyces microflavus]|uniref:HTH gntR-type domain-containing protein n=1 Tax=Streptomyces microflavus TaxID=1919 RepID=A0A7J0CM39_STRMI|nr:hypothetical protein Smic_13810 [Streptomyces microflavus]